MASEMNMLLEKATSALLLEVDITYTLQIVDLIRQNDVSPKVAVQSIFTRLKDKNPNVVLMTFQVLEYVVKNCGEAVHEEVCSRGSCEAMEELIRNNTNEEVRSAACYLLGSWCSAFKGNPKLSAVQDLANILRAKGHHIPQSSEAAALYSADMAPHWADANCCHRCRSNFTLIKRKHHCRACGQVFCHECSSRSSNIPKYGIEKEVRVCETCYTEINSPTSAKAKAKDDSTASPAKKAAATSGPAPAAGGKTEAELREEEELQLALALSKSEAENKEKEKLRVTSSLLSGGGWRASNGVSAPPHSPSPPPASNGGNNNELDKYLNRPYWEEQQKAQQQHIYANVGSKEPSITKGPALMGDDAPEDRGGPIRVASPPPTTSKASEALQMSNENEVSEFVATFRAQLEIFVNRLKSNQSRGRPIANDTAVQSLFVNITAMHGQLLLHLQQQEARRVWYEQMQDKLSQTRDARAALEALREEHRDRERREREEQQKIRQIQMMQKLEVMRKKKQEYLEYQRQLAVHRMAQTERQLLQQPQQYYAPPPGAMGPGVDLLPQGGPPPPGGQPPMPGGPGGYPPNSLPGYHDNGQQPPSYLQYGQQQHMGGGGGPQPPFTSMVTSPGQTPPQMHNQMGPQQQQQQLGPVQQIQPQMGGPGQQQGIPQMGGPGQLPPQMAPGQQASIPMGQQMGPGQLQPQPMSLGQAALPPPPQQQPPLPRPEEAEAALISFD